MKSGNVPIASFYDCYMYWKEQIQAKHCCNHLDSRFERLETHRRISRSILHNTVSIRPLWWKALVIIQCEPLGSELKRIVSRSGGFHADMSYLGCIVHIMASSGLQ